MTVVPFPGVNRRPRLPDPTRKPGGEVSISTSDTNGGSWSVSHLSESGDSGALLWDGIHDLNKATRIAREFAIQHNARFDDGEPQPPRGAA